MAGELSSAMSAYALSVRFDDIGQTNVALMTDAFVNWVGCAVGGSNTPTAEAAVRGYLSINPDGRERSFGRTERFSLLDAISLDCLSSSSLAYDDTHLETVLHPAGPIAAALLGLARTRPLRGTDFIAAFFVGVEIECRVGLSFASAGTGAHPGWYATGMSGGIGAAAAVGRVLGFNNDQMLNAIGLAAARASGNRGTHGTMAGVYVPAVAAESGFVAAKLTEAGFTCGARALDGSNGMLELLTKKPGIERALRELGKTSEACKTAFKPWPAGIVTHAVNDACVLLAKEHGVSLDDVEQIELTISQPAHFLGANRDPKDEHESNVCLAFWTGHVLAAGPNPVPPVDMSHIKDPKLIAFQDRVSLTVAPEMTLEQCAVKAKLKSGRVVNVRIDHAKGSTANPMTAADVDAKFTALATRVYPRERTEKLLKMARDVLKLDDVSSVLSV